MLQFIALINGHESWNVAHDAKIESNDVVVLHIFHATDETVNNS